MYVKGRRKKAAIVLASLATLLVIAGSFSYFSSPPRGESQGPKPEKGSTFVYELSNEMLPTTAHGSGVINQSLLFELYNNYTEVLRHEVSGTIGTQGMHPAECKISSQQAYLTFGVIRDTGLEYVVNVTMTLSDGTANCGAEFGDLPKSDASWTMTNGSYFSAFRTLNMTKQMVVNATSSNVEGDKGYPYGEWPFWLSKNDLKARYTLVLYTLVDSVITNIGVSKIAQVIPLNSSNYGVEPYTAKGVNVSPQNQILSKKSSLPVEGIYYGIPPDNASSLITGIQKEYSRLGVSPFAFPIHVYYRNGNLYQNADTVWQNLTLSYKSWSWNPQFLELNGSLQLPAGGSWPRASIIYPGLVYDDIGYVTTGFLGLSSASYSRSGVLLHIAGTGVEDLLSTPIERAFAISYVSSSAPTTELSLMAYMPGE